MLSSVFVRSIRVALFVTLLDVVNFIVLLRNHIINEVYLQSYTFLCKEAVRVSIFAYNNM